MTNMLLKDFEYISRYDIDWQRFKGKRFLVTGATGLIGSLFIKAILYVSEKKDLGISVIAMVRNEQKAKDLFGDFKNVDIYVCDLAGKGTIDIDAKIDFVLHTAAVTVSKEMIAYPVDNIKTSIDGTIKVLDYSRENMPEGVVYLSSMEAYGQMNVTDHLVSEDELGKIDLSSVRSCYPEGKRMCECICKAYASQYDVNVVSARLAQTFGPGISKNENRVFAQFARSAIEGKDIVLHTKGQSEGNYVYTADAIRAILTLFLNGKKGEIYNVVNENNHMSISQMAEMVASKISSGNIKVTYDIPEDVSSTGYAADTKMHLSAAKINELGWKAEVSLEEMYNNLIAYIKED